MANVSRSRERRKYQWIRESVPLTETADSAVSSLLRISNAEMLAAGISDPTIVRIRGDVMFTMDPATSSDGSAQRVGFGIIVLPEAVTVAEYGGTGTNPNDDWLTWRTISLQSPTLPAASEQEWGVGTWRLEFDIKAMRRLQGSKALVAVAHNLGDSVAHVFVGAAWSVLFQE